MVVGFLFLFLCDLSDKEKAQIVHECLHFAAKQNRDVANGYISFGGRACWSLELPVEAISSFLNEEISPEDLSKFDAIDTNKTCIPIKDFEGEGAKHFLEAGISFFIDDKSSILVGLEMAFRPRDPKERELTAYMGPDLIIFMRYDKDKEEVVQYREISIY